MILNNFDIFLFHEYYEIIPFDSSKPRDKNMLCLANHFFPLYTIFYIKKKLTSQYYHFLYYIIYFLLLF